VTCVRRTASLNRRAVVVAGPRVGVRELRVAAHLERAVGAADAERGGGDATARGAVEQIAARLGGAAPSELLRAEARRA
jgi:hypothetical protein